MSQERSLCPVRALAFYLDRSKSLRDRTQRKLFIPYRKTSRKRYVLILPLVGLNLSLDLLITKKSLIRFENFKFTAH